MIQLIHSAPAVNKFVYLTSIGYIFYSSPARGEVA
jgi:hypothetical protein